MLPRPDGHRPARGCVLDDSYNFGNTMRTHNTSMDLDAGAAEWGREKLNKALAAKDSKEALKICEDFEMQVSPARGRAAWSCVPPHLRARNAGPQAAHRAARRRARAWAVSLPDANRLGVVTLPQLRQAPM